MRRLAILSILLTSALLGGGAGAATLLLRPARVWTAGEPVHSGWVVLIEGERIIAVGPLEAVTAPAGATVVDLPGETLIPGLMDLHSHLLLHPYNEAPWDDQVVKEPQPYRTLRAGRHAEATLMAGFTTLRDLGTEGAGYADVSLKRAIDEGVIPGPRLFVATRAIVAAGAYGPAVRNYRSDVDLPQGAQEASGVDDVVKAVREQAARGADWIKLYADYRVGPSGETEATFSVDELKAATEAAESCAGRDLPLARGAPARHGRVASHHPHTVLNRAPPRLPRRFTLFVVAAMIGGVLAGFVLNQTVGDPAKLRQIADGLGIVTDVFLRLIRMIIAPLVFSTLVVGIAHMEDTAAIGRVGLKALGWFVCASVVSLTIGLIMVHLLQPGVGLHLVAPAAVAGQTAAQPLTLKDFITHVFPTSIIKAMADNEILQIVVFSVFVGTAMSAIEGRAPAVMALAEQVAQIMLKVTGYVMLFAPFAIFAALASTVATQGAGVLVGYARFVGGFYLSLGLLWSVMIAVCFLAVGKRVWRLAALMRDPALLAFSTASSEAAYPRTLEALQTFGVSRRIASFVLPLGYSFNLVGSMMYCTFATLFIAQAYRVPMTLAQQVIMLLVLMVTSKGIAGVPRAALVVVAATLPTFHLPEAGLLLILAVDHLLDMGRSSTNVVGNSVAATMIAVWEHELGNETSEVASAAAA